MPGLRTVPSPSLRLAERSPVCGPVDARLRALFDDEIERWSVVEPSTARLIGDLADFVLVGGKRLRPEFVHWGFVGAGGDPDDPRVVSIGAATELLHAFALLHDDVMDGACTRRGRPAQHVRIEAEHRASRWRGDPRRFGEGLAILLGDLAFVYADRLLRDAGPTVEHVWDELRIELTMGQYLDVTGAARGEHDLRRAELIARYKSGRYSVERPLHLGAALADRLADLEQPLRRFGSPLGEAFQLRDDLLGVFGDPAMTGKPVGDDLREGKPTVLVAYAHALAPPDVAGRLDAIGDASLSDDDVVEIQQLLVEVGAVDSVERAIAVRADAARTALDAAPITDPARDALAGLVDRLAWRTS
jgi:geranylgeranyl diphosphate synthase type I